LVYIRIFYFVRSIRYIVNIQYRKRFTPVALAAKASVAQPVVDLSLADALFYQCVDGFFRSFGNAFARQECAVLYNACFLGTSFFARILVTKDVGDGQLEMFSESMVAFIAAGHGHNGAGAIACNTYSEIQTGICFSVTDG
jgi:hypothetical protein